jgi:hypothetical protein
MGLERFLDITDAPERSIGVINRTQPEPFQLLIEKLFTNQDISVTEETISEYDDNTVALLENGTVVETSSLRELQDAILLVNSDLFITGTRTLEGTSLPAVIEGLSGTRFRLRGYPASDTEKLLLILISRHIEKRAFETGAGTLRSSFQRLSRLNDEQGTRRVYERVADTDVDVHLYGQPDWTPPADFPVTIHGGYTRDFRDSWFVIHCPPPGTDRQPSALLAIEVSPQTWDGFWTYEPDLVDQLTTYIKTKL